MGSEVGRRLGALATLACLMAVVAACGNGGGSAVASSNVAPKVGTSGVHLGSPVVVIDATDQLRFSPATQTLHVGDIVEWTNVGTVQHTVTFDAQPYLTDPALDPGAAWEIKLTETGTYPYRCTIHPGMNGTLVVR